MPLKGRMRYEVLPSTQDNVTGWRVFDHAEDRFLSRFYLWMFDALEACRELNKAFRLSKPRRRH